MNSNFVSLKVDIWLNHLQEKSVVLKYVGRNEFGVVSIGEV